MTKPLTPTLAICLAASAAMVGALFADPDEPKASGLDATSASQSAEPSPSTDESSDDTTSEGIDHESHEGGKDKRNNQPSDQTTEPAQPSTEPTTDDPGETPSEKPDDYNEDRDGNGSADGADTKSPADHTMRINNFQIPSVTVAPGDVVKVINNDDVMHTVTADDGSFTTDEIPAGQSRTFQAPLDAGAYGVFCKPHPDMTATITVS